MWVLVLVYLACPSGQPCYEAKIKASMPRGAEITDKDRMCANLYKAERKKYPKVKLKYVECKGEPK
jgi:hypothetical protein